MDGIFGLHGVIPLSPNNLHRTVGSIIKRAELDPISRPFQVFRQSCETEWSMTLPQHAVSVWLGHSETVSRKHYLLVPDELFDRAAGKVPNAPDEGAAESAAVDSGTNSQAPAMPSEYHDVSCPDNP